jgi:hypothetical protein
MFGQRPSCSWWLGCNTRRVSGLRRRLLSNDLGWRCADGWERHHLGLHRRQNAKRELGRVNRNAKRELGRVNSDWPLLVFALLGANLGRSRTGACLHRGCTAAGHLPQLLLRQLACTTQVGQ